MSVAYGNILRMNDKTETWYKWDYVCPNCDANIEMTAKPDGHSHDSYCLKCAGDLVLMSVVDVTIYPTTKEDKMETTTEYNPNLLVTYKKIENGETTYPTDKVTDIEWSLNNYRLVNQKNIEQNIKINKLENVLISYAQDADEETLELITEIANIFDISLTKEIEVTGTISFSATITVPLTEDYDIESICQEVISVTSYDGDTDVNDYSVDDVRESY